MPSKTEPNSWRINTIGDLCSLETETVKAAESNCTDYIGLEHLTSGRFFLSASASPKDFKSTAHKFQPGDVLYGKLRPYLDKAVFAKNEGVCSTEILVLRPKISSDAAYILSVLHSKEFIDYAQSSADKQFPRTSWGWVSKFSLNIPDASERRIIGALFWKVQQSITAESKAIETTQRLKARTMKFLFSYGISDEDQKESELGLIPKSWEVAPLAKVVTEIDYGVSAAIPKESPPNGVKIVSTADIDRQGNILYYKIRKIEVKQELASRLALQTGDVLFNWRNSPELIGKTGIFIAQAEPHIFASFILRMRCDESKYHNYFLSYFLNYQRESGVFITLARKAVNQANYNRNEISVLPVPVPPLSQQRAIATVLRQIDSRLEIHQRRLQSFIELFRALQSRILDASIRVADLDIDTTCLEPQGAAA